MRVFGICRKSLPDVINILDTSEIKHSVVYQPNQPIGKVSVFIGLHVFEKYKDNKKIRVAVVLDNLVLCSRIKGAKLLDAEQQGSFTFKPVVISDTKIGSLIKKYSKRSAINKKPKIRKLDIIGNVLGNFTPGPELALFQKFSYSISSSSTRLDLQTKFYVWLTTNKSSESLITEISNMIDTKLPMYPAFVSWINNYGVKYQELFHYVTTSRDNNKAFSYSKLIKERQLPDFEVRYLAKMIQKAKKVCMTVRSMKEIFDATKLLAIESIESSEPTEI